uniref:UBIQUITIN_CONJUGAT_2 domain-containing protein n=1 Tax=Syphacia muris TaxID=451379 RepID=A0A158R584_9BILA
MMLENSNTSEIIDEEIVSVTCVTECLIPSSLKDVNNLLYLESTNSIFMQDPGGNIAILDGNLERSMPLATASIEPDTLVTYDRQNELLIALNRRKICFRKDYAGCYMLKNLFAEPVSGRVKVELPVEEAASFAKLADMETFLSCRPTLKKFIQDLAVELAAASSSIECAYYLPKFEHKRKCDKLFEFTGLSQKFATIFFEESGFVSGFTIVLCRGQETIVVDVMASEILPELRSLDAASNTSDDCNMDWSNPVWPLISALAERVRLLLSPERPYNFDYTLEWKGIDKEVMVSEAARRLTFEHWPHMNYRWALPCQMAEAGFYHQPNKSGDDRVLCFACLVCLVCWEPSDEPWSEHERHSTSCKFIRNSSNPNVPLALTMSSLGPFNHEMKGDKPENFIVSTTSNTEWIATANKYSSTIGLWRTDRVVQSIHSLNIDQADIYIALKTGYCASDQESRSHRINCSDKSTSALTAEKHQDCVSKNAQNTTEGNFKEIQITCLCTVGQPCVIDSNTADTSVVPVRSTPAVIASILINCRQRCSMDDQSFYSTVSGGIGSEDGFECRPLLLIYQINETGKSDEEITEVDGRAETVKLSGNIADAVDIFGTQNGDYDPEFGTVMVVDGENETSNWSDLQQAYDNVTDKTIDTGVDNSDGWSEGSKNVSKFDEKCSDFMPISYEPPPVNVLLTQCFHLPQELDEDDMKITGLLPSRNGQMLIVIVNRKEHIPSKVMSAVLVYRLIFSECGVTVQEQPLKILTDNSTRITEFCFSDVDFFASVYGNADNTCARSFIETGIIRTEENNAFLLDLHSNKQVKVCNDKAKQVIAMEGGRCAVLTVNGKVLLFQVEISSTRRICNEDELEAVFSSILDICSALRTSIISVGIENEKKALEQLLLEKQLSFSLLNEQGLSFGKSDSPLSLTDFLSVKPLSTQVLKEMWNLTRSDSGASVNSASSFGLPSSSSLASHGFSVIASQGWAEVQLHQKFRKKPQHYVRSGHFTRSWHWRSDFTDKVPCHIFELRFQLPSNISHVNIRFSLHHSCTGSPDIQVTVLRRRLESSLANPTEAVLLNQPVFRSSESLGNSFSKFDAKELRNQCDVVAGPFHFSSFLENDGLSALIQLPGSVFLPEPNTLRAGKSNSYKMPTFYLLVETINDLSVEQIISAYRNFCKEKAFVEISAKSKLNVKKKDGFGNGSTVKKLAKKKNNVSGICEQDVRNYFMDPGWRDFLTSIKKGIEWIDGVHITLFRSKRLSGLKERIERRLMIEMKNMHVDLVAAAVNADKFISNSIITTGERLLRSHLSLDIIFWLLDNWVASSNKSYMIDFGKLITEYLDVIIRNGFINTQRSVSHKWCSLLNYVLRILKTLDLVTYENFIWKMLCSLEHAVERAFAFENAGSLHWFFIVAFSFLQAMYEWPLNVLSLCPRSSNTSGSCKGIGNAVNSIIKVNASSPYSNLLPAQVIPSKVQPMSWSNKQKPIHYWQSKKQDKNGLSAQNNSTNSSGRGKTSSLPQLPLLTNATVDDLISQDEMEWFEIFNLNISEERESSLLSDVAASTLPPGTGIYRLNDSINVSDSSQRIFLSPSQLSGLLEVEPLTFTCVDASDQIKIENVETGAVTMIHFSTNTSVRNHASVPPVPLKVAKIPSMVDPSATISQQFRYLPDNDAYLNLKTVEGFVHAGNDGLEKKTVTSGNCSQSNIFAARKVSDITGEPQKSSSTSGALSEQEILSNASETSSSVFVSNTHADYGCSVIDTDTEQCDDKASVSRPLSTTISVVSSDLLRPPPRQVLIIDRMAVGARKFVILDFGLPVLLTDILIPSCAELASVFVDVWLLGESTDGQLLTNSSQIGYKSIVLQDITPSMLVRFVKITYVGRQDFNSSCRIPFGLFFGHRFFSSWQTYACSQTFGSVTPSTASATISQLRRLCEDLRCRHQLCCAELQQLVKENASVKDVKRVYKDCISFRAQWNVFYNVVRRIENDLHSSSGSNVDYRSGWSVCCLDQLRIAADELFVFLSVSAHLLDVRAVAVYTTVHAVSAFASQGIDVEPVPIVEAVSVSPTVEQIAPLLLTLEMAVSHFSLFCTLSMPKLQIECASWIFHHGGSVEWWPRFFSSVLAEVFSGPYRKGDEKVFLLLSYLCCHSVKTSSVQSQIVLELLKFIEKILKCDLESGSRLSNNETVNYTLLCWSLMLLSSAFDVVIGSKRKTDRWAFLAGEFASQIPLQTTDKNTELFTKNKKPIFSANSFASLTCVEKCVKKESIFNAFSQSSTPQAAVDKSGLDLALEQESKPFEKFMSGLQFNASNNGQQKQELGSGIAAIFNSCYKDAKEINLPKKSDDKGGFAEKTQVSCVNNLMDSVKLHSSGNSWKTACVELNTDHPGTFEASFKVPDNVSKPDVMKNLSEEAPANNSAIDSPSVTNSFTSSRSSRVRARGGRQRQYNVRLRLPLEICMSVAKELCKIFCSKQDQIPTAGKLVICKVLARICANASHRTIPLVCVMEDRINEIVKIAVNIRSPAMVRYSVLCLLLDCIEAESRAVAKNACTSRHAELARAALDTVSDPVDIDSFCRKLVGVPYLVIFRYVAQKNAEACDIPDWTSSGQTAFVSSLPSVFADCKTSKSFSIANYDEVPKSNDILDSILHDAVKYVDPISLVVPCAVPMEVRTEALRDWCQETIKELIIKQPSTICYTFRCIDNLRLKEATFVKLASSAAEYLRGLKEQKFLISSVPPSCSLVSPSALITCIRYAYDFMAAENLVEERKKFIENEFSNISSQAAESLVVCDGDLEEVALKEVDDILEQGKMDALNAVDAYAKNMSDSITKGAESFFVETEQNTFNSQKEMEQNFENKGDVKSAETAKTCDASTFDFLEINRKFSKQALLEHIMLSFLIEMKAASEDVVNQPIAYAIDERLECQLGLMPYISCQAVNTFVDTLSRHSVRRLSPWRRYSFMRSRPSSDEQLKRFMGATLEVTHSALSKLINSLSPLSSGEYAIRLLNFYSDFFVGIAGSVKRLPVETTWILETEGVDAILLFSVLSVDMNERLWTSVFRTLDKIVGASTSIAKHLIKSSKFHEFISRFVMQGTTSFDDFKTAGPVVIEAMGSLLRKIRSISCCADNLINKLLIIIRDFISSKNTFHTAYPLDVLMEILNVAKRSGRGYAGLSSEILGNFAASVIEFARCFFVTRSSARSTQFSLSPETFRHSEICFQQMKVNNSSSNGDFSKALSGDYASSNSGFGSLAVNSVGAGIPTEPVLQPKSRRDDASAHNKMELFIQSLLSEVSIYLFNNKAMVKALLTSHAAAVDGLLQILSLCHSAGDDFNSISFNDWYLVSSADYVFNITVQIAKHADDNLKKFLSSIIFVLSQFDIDEASNKIMNLSKPLAFAITHILSNFGVHKVFIELGGHLLVAKQLEKFISNSVETSVTPLFAPVLRQLVSLSSQVASGENVVTMKKPYGGKVNGLYNYASLCSISSSSMMAHQLTSLLSTSAPHRRARTANWSYNFYADEEWLDITLTLPYQITLHEIHIRPHVPALNTGPSAVQVELCSDASLQTWTILGPPLLTLGLNKIRIPTLTYPYPVCAVRLNLRRPPDSANMGLSQILVLGNSSSQFLSAKSFPKVDFANWLLILDKLCQIEDNCIWNYAPDLPRALTSLFLGRSLELPIYKRIAALLSLIDETCPQSSTVVQLIIEYLGITLSSETKSLTHIKRQKCVLRQRQLLFGMLELLSANEDFTAFQQVSLAVVLWTSSCVVWKNLSDEEMCNDTISTCTEIFSDILPKLISISVNENGHYIEKLASSAAWLLCSFVRAVPRVREVFTLLENTVTNISSKSSNLPVLKVASKMCQSATAVRQLMSLGFLSAWTSMIVQICEVNLTESSLKSCEFSRLEELVSLVWCLASLSSITIVIDYLDNEGSILFKPLIFFSAVSVKYASHVANKWPFELENATIDLLCRCASAGSGHRKRISDILCNLLKTSGLSGSAQQMVLQNYLPFATLTLDVFSDRLLHPVFGCFRQEHLKKVSLYSAFHEVFPNSAKNNLNEKVCNPEIQINKTVLSDNSFSYKEDTLVTFLLCDAYSPNLPVSGAMKIGYFIDLLRDREQMQNKVSDEKQSGEKHQELSVIRKKFIDFTDGFFTLELKVAVAHFSELCDLAKEEESSSLNFDSLVSSQFSTLYHFARGDGLALLTQNLQLYQPSHDGLSMFSSPLSTRSVAGVSKAGELSQSASSVVDSAFDLSAYPLFIDQLVQDDTYGTGPFVTKSLASTFCDDVANVYDHQWESYYDAVPIGQTTADHFNKNLSGSVVNINTLPPQATVPFHLSHMKEGRKAALFHPLTVLSPHVIVAFSVLLRLDSYAEHLVSFDRRRTKKLLQLAMGIFISDRVKNGSESHALNRGMIFDELTKNEIHFSENERLALLPFIVLKELYKVHTPDSSIGKSVRKKSIQYGVIDIVLNCLSHYAHQSHKVCPIRPESLLPAPETVSFVEKMLKLAGEMDAVRLEIANSSSCPGYEERLAGLANYNLINQQPVQSQSYWAKGTGFGSGTTQQQWNVDLHVMRRKADERNVTYLLQVLANYICPCDVLSNFESTLSTTGSETDLETVSPADDSGLEYEVIQLLERSCLFPTIWSYLRNDSVLDISKHVDVYDAVIRFIGAFTLSAPVYNHEGVDVVNRILSASESGVTMLTMLKKLNDCIHAYLNKITQSSEEIQSLADDEAKNGEEGLIRLSPLILRTCAILSKRVGNEPVETRDDKKGVLTVEEMYTNMMRKLQFETVPFFNEERRIPFHYENSLPGISFSASTAKRTRRLAQEIVTLSNSLPLSLSSSVFVRAAEERIDAMKVLITGPADTPYMNGCFEFDVWFPTEYPNMPMLINLETTGNHTVRFNPNLYNDGKVCLSVLNTWHGRPEERWNPETSSFLQVIVSMQSLILVSEPYFNEPGYERSKCTETGQQASLEYDSNIRQATVKWAMLEMIRHPPIAFEDIVRKHFWFKRHEITSQITNWIKEGEKRMEEQQGNSAHLQALQTHLTSLKRHWSALKEELERLKCPDGVDMNCFGKDLSSLVESPGSEHDEKSISNDLKAENSIKVLKL